ncbi:MAG: dockerin type I repeat-containing protein [Firmicutes bacterium]|nr:dockerin type I repeat-containing protein [Bacillota bacterium]
MSFRHTNSRRSSLAPGALRLFCLSLAAALCLALFPAAAFADTVGDYGLAVGGVAVTASNASNITGPGISGSASFDPKTNTLTLEDFSYTGPGYETEGFGGTANYCLFWGGGNEITVELKGSSSIAPDDITPGHRPFGLYSYNTIYFSGDGSLTLEPGTVYDVTGYTLYCEGDIVFLSPCHVSVFGHDSINSEDGSSYAVYATTLNLGRGSLFARGGAVSSTGEYCSVESYGVYLKGNASITDGTLCAIGGSASGRARAKSYGLRGGYPGSVSISGNGTLIAAGGNVYTSSESADYWLGSFGVTTNLQVYSGTAIIQGGNCDRPAGLFSMESVALMGRPVADFSDFFSGGCSDGSIIIRAGMLNGGYLTGESAYRRSAGLAPELTNAKLVGACGRDEDGEYIYSSAFIGGIDPAELDFDPTGFVIVPEDYEYGIQPEDSDSYLVSFKEDVVNIYSADMNGHALVLADLFEHDRQTEQFILGGDTDLSNGDLTVATGLFTEITGAGPATASYLSFSGNCHAVFAAAPVKDCDLGLVAYKLDVSGLSDTGSLVIYGDPEAMDIRVFDPGDHVYFDVSGRMLIVPQTEDEEQILPPPLLPGDMDLDGEVDAADLTALARMVAGIEVPDDPQILAGADVNGDGIVDAKDLTALARFVAGIVDVIEQYS